MSATPQQYLLAALGGLFAASLPFYSEVISLAIAVAAFCVAVLVARNVTQARIAAGFGVIYVLAMVGGLYLLREGA